MKIEILGTGCNKCSALEENVKKALALSGAFAQVIKVEDIQKIMDYGVMNTPALVVNGEVKITGKLLNPKEIQKILNDS